MRTVLIASAPLLLLATAAVIVAQPPPLTTGKAQTIIVEQSPDGTVVHRSADGKIVAKFDATAAAQPQAGVRYAVPMAIGDGRTVFAYGQSPDPETAEMMREESLAANEARALVANLQGAESDGDKEKIKTQLREKLVAIFDMQQKRRAREVAKIEERLAKLKDTMKKREAAKDSIIDRRLDTLTGGVDELGWEETFPLGGPNAANGYRSPNYPQGPQFAPVPPPGTRGQLSVPPALPVPSAAPPAVAPPAGLPTLPSPTPVAPGINLPGPPSLPGTTPAAPRGLPPTPALPPTAPAAPAAEPRINPPATSAADDFIGR